MHCSASGITCAKLSTEVQLEGSTLTVWDRHQEPSLLPYYGPGSMWAATTEEAAAWEREGIEFVTILDDRYPYRLRSFREAPAILFPRP